VRLRNATLEIVSLRIMTMAARTSLPIIRVADLGKSADLGEAAGRGPVGLALAGEFAAAVTNGLCFEVGNHGGDRRRSPLIR
jgi:hypothetical protein